MIPTQSRREGRSFFRLSGEGARQGWARRPLHAHHRNVGSPSRPTPVDVAAPGRVSRPRAPSNDEQFVGRLSSRARGVSCPQRQQIKVRLSARRTQRWSLSEVLWRQRVGPAAGQPPDNSTDASWARCATVRPRESRGHPSACLRRRIADLLTVSSPVGALTQHRPHSLTRTQFFRNPTRPTHPDTNNVSLYVTASTRYSFSQGSSHPDRMPVHKRIACFRATERPVNR
jgi:hypothetical protein